MNIICPNCPHCQKDSTVEVDFNSYLMWRNGTLIQTAFPNMSIGEREMLITGIHPECWDIMFPDEE